MPRPITDDSVGAICPDPGLEVPSVQRIGYRYQRTLRRPVTVTGVGIVTGAAVRLRLAPAAPDTGIEFVRADLPNSQPIPATVAEVTDTRRRTTLGHNPYTVTLVEHVLSALAGLRVDNVHVELDGPEPPGLDGSSLGFVDAIIEAGIELQVARRPIYSVTRTVCVSRDHATIMLHPGTTPELRISYLLDYGAQAAIPRQGCTFTITPESYRRELAGCRTFLLESEVATLQGMGIGRHLTNRDVLVFGPRGPINNSLRFADEPARHKSLDILGDLALAGFDIAGHLVAYRSGHALNIELATELAGQLGGTVRLFPTPTAARAA
ncbi:MAG: UDP-3-O-acyl-N-acetylglucosamine deacetylase [Gemmataceae bacterium]